MGVGAGLYMCVVVVQKFTFAISSPDEFLCFLYFIVTQSDTSRHTRCTQHLAIQLRLHITRHTAQSYSPPLSLSLSLCLSSQFPVRSGIIYKRPWAIIALQLHLHILARLGHPPILIIFMTSPQTQRVMQTYVSRSYSGNSKISSDVAQKTVQCNGLEQGVLVWLFR